MKKNCIKLLFVLPLLAAVLATARPAAAITPQEIIKNAIDAYKKLDSYEYTDVKHGLDTFARKQAKSMEQANQSLAQGQGVEVKSKVNAAAAPKLTDARYFVRFMKPYVIQMVIDRLDLAPDLVIQAKMTYNGVKEPKVWWAKLKFMPTPIKRSVAKDDASGFLTMGWGNALLQMQNLTSNGTVKLLGKEKAVGQECYVIEVTFAKDAWKKFKPIKPNLAEWGFPAEIAKFVTEDLSDPLEKKYTSVKYWITVKEFYLVKTEDYVGGKFFWRNEFAKIKVNQLAKKDFSPK